MGVIAFRTPQDGLNQLQNAVDLMSLIRTIANDPKIGETVDDLSQKLSQAQDIGEEKRKEAAAAQEIIAQAKEASEDLDVKKSEHDAQISADLADIANSRASLKADQMTLENERKIAKAQVDKAMQDIQDKVSLASKLNEEAKARNAEAEKLESDLEAKQAEHEKTVADFENSKAQVEQELSDRAAELDQKAKDLAAERVEFEAYKQRIKAALGV